MTPHEIADELEATVRHAGETLRGLDDSILCHRPSPDRWTIKQVIGPLIDSAANNHQRFVRGQFTERIDDPSYRGMSAVELATATTSGKPAGT